MLSLSVRKKSKDNNQSSGVTRKPPYKKEKETPLTMKSGAHSAGLASSDSEEEDAKKSLLRKVSTKKQLHSKACIKEGYLFKQMAFQRWRRRYFKLRPHRLFYAKRENSEIFDEIELTDSSVAEKSTKKVNCSFSIIGPSYKLMLCADSRKEMDEWISAIKAVQSREFYSPHQLYMDNFSDGHNWYACNHNRPTYCNVCRDALSGVMYHGLSCDVCKFKSHKRCACKATNNCKWTTLATVGKNIIESEDGLSIPHQWLEGNLPVSAKCVVCERTCGSVLRMQDWRCLWCRAIVHASCRNKLPEKCSLGSCNISILPPTAIHSHNSDDFWLASPSTHCSSPLLVFVNSKSGDNQGVKFLRRFRQFLNPAQVFDLMCSGPNIGLQMFCKFDIFRILICGGDGSVGWVLAEMDKLNLSAKAMVGVLPLGTGNDLAQVMGWGNMCDDDTQVPYIIEKYERASARLLDRWSILVYEGKLPLSLPPPVAPSPQHSVWNDCPITEYEDTVADHLGALLNSDKMSVVVNSASVLCETVKDFVTKVGKHSTEDNTEMPVKCRLLEAKLASLLDTLTVESKMAELEQACEDTDVDVHQEASTSQSGSVQEMESVYPSERSKADSSNLENDNLLPDADLPFHFNVTSECLETVPEVHVTSCDVDDVSGSMMTQTIKVGALSSRKPLQKKTPKKRVFEQRSQLMLRANSLKKVVRQIIEHTEQAVDEQNQYTRRSLGLADENETPLLPELLAPSFVSSRPALALSDDDDARSCGDDRILTGSELPRLHLPLVKQKSRSAPSTPTSTLGPPRFDKSLHQSSTESALSPARQREPSYGLISLSQFRKSSTAINPLYNPSQRSTFLSRVLLANADALCAPAAPFLQADDSMFRSLFTEKCVMNNYFGIGLDAKITLDFHKKREDNPKKCSRTKNRMWFGMLATKEFAMKTYRNLEQRVRLECDGHLISLPPLQGLVVLNIPSYAGGSNFWGSRTADEVFMAPSYNDKTLEVVAVFSTVQLGMAIVAPDGVWQHHRIAQCKSVKITILGDEAVPLQTDGEAWLQPPGIIKIEHKNRVQMLARDRRLEVALKTWEMKNRNGSEKNSSSSEQLSDSEVFMIGQLAGTATTIAISLSESESASLLKEELLPLASTILRLNAKLRPLGRVSNTASCHLVAKFVMVVREFKSQLEVVTNKKANSLKAETIQKSQNWSDWLEHEIKKVRQIKWVAHVEQHNNIEISADIPHSSKSSTRASTRFKLFRKSIKKGDAVRYLLETEVGSWSVHDVVLWLESNHLHDLCHLFLNNSIDGEKLLNLDNSALKNLRVTKPEHIKKLLSILKDLQK